MYWRWCNQITSVKVELEMWEKEVSVQEVPDQSGDGEKKKVVLVVNEEGEEGEEDEEDEFDIIEGFDEDDEVSTGNDIRREGGGQHTSEMQVHRVYLEEPSRPEEPSPIGVVQLSSEGTLRDVRWEVQRDLDTAPRDFTFLFDGIPVSHKQEHKLRAAFCDHIILRPVAAQKGGHKQQDTHTAKLSWGDASAKKMASALDASTSSDPGQPSKRLSSTGSPMPVARADRPSPPQPSGQASSNTATGRLPAKLQGVGASSSSRNPASSVRVQWRPSPTMTAAKRPQRERPFVFGQRSERDPPTVPKAFGKNARQAEEQASQQRREILNRLVESRRMPASISSGQKAALERLRRFTAHSEVPHERLSKHSVWKQGLTGPLLVIEHDSGEPRYWGCAVELTVAMRRAGIPVQQYLANPRAAGDASLESGYRSYNRFCFPDGIRFRPRVGSFEVFLVTPPSYQVLHSKLVSGRWPWIAAIVELARSAVSADGGQSRLKQFRCREDTQIGAPLPPSTLGPTQLAHPPAATSAVGTSYHADESNTSSAQQVAISLPVRD